MRREETRNRDYQQARINDYVLPGPYPPQALQHPPYLPQNEGFQYANPNIRIFLDVFWLLMVKNR